jgi:hypothetical protein
MKTRFCVKNLPIDVHLQLELHTRIEMASAPPLENDNFLSVKFVRSAAGSGKSLWGAHAHARTHSGATPAQAHETLECRSRPLCVLSGSKMAPETDIQKWRRATLA